MLTDKLAQKADQLQHVNQRMAELIQTNLLLTAENDTCRMLQKVCGYARHLVGAKYVIAGLHTEGQLHYTVGSGLDSIEAQRMGTPLLRESVPTQAHGEQRYRVEAFALPSSQQELGLHSLVAVPIASPQQPFGWLWLADKLGADDFSEDDTHLMSLLGAQVGRLCEKHSLYAELREQATQLKRDLAERHRAEARLIELSDRLQVQAIERAADFQSASEELESISFSISHDLREPLRAVTGFADILGHEYAAPMAGEGRRLLTKVIDNARLMERRIDGLILLFRVSRMPLTKRPLNMISLVRGVLEEVRRHYPGRDDAVRVGDLPDCHADSALLKYVLVNLLSNAFKFCRDRAVPLIEIAGETRADEEVYFVRDNGAGFDSRYADRLFGMFQRLHRADVFEGSGVGLAVAQRIVRRHGGRIWAEGEVDRGATFSFALPIPAVRLSSTPTKRLLDST